MNSLRGSPCEKTCSIHTIHTVMFFLQLCNPLGYFGPTLPPSNNDNYTGWWFQIPFYFHPYLGKIPIFFKWVETTNQLQVYTDSLPTTVIILVVTGISVGREDPSDIYQKAYFPPNRYGVLHCPGNHSGNRRQGASGDGKMWTGGRQT